MIIIKNFQTQGQPLFLLLHQGPRANSANILHLGCILSSSWLHIITLVKITTWIVRKSSKTFNWRANINKYTMHPCNMIRNNHYLTVVSVRTTILSKRTSYYKIIDPPVTFNKRKEKGLRNNKEKRMKKWKGSSINRMWLGGNKRFKIAIRNNYYREKRAREIESQAKNS